MSWPVCWKFNTLEYDVFWRFMTFLTSWTWRFMTSQWTIRLNCSRFDHRDGRFADDNFAQPAQCAPPPWPGVARWFPPMKGEPTGAPSLGPNEDAGPEMLCPAFYMHRTVLQRAAAVGIFPQSRCWDVVVSDVASEFLGGGCTSSNLGAVSSHAWTNSRGKGRQTLSISTLTAVASTINEYFKCDPFSQFQLNQMNLKQTPDSVSGN